MSKKHHSHKPGIVSNAINGVGLAIAFNQGISAVTDTVLAGQPARLLPVFVYRESGWNMDSKTFDFQQFGMSALSKVAAFAWVKLAHMVTRRMRIKI